MINGQNILLVYRHAKLQKIILSINGNVYIDKYENLVKILRQHFIKLCLVQETCNQIYEKIEYEMYIKNRGELINQLKYNFFIIIL